MCSVYISTLRAVERTNVHSISMASEEDRSKILAEYKAASEAAIFNEEDDDEVDFDPSDGEFSGDDDSSDDNDDQEPDPVVLNGSIHLNDEGRIIYSGTWRYIGYQSFS